MNNTTFPVISVVSSEVAGEEQLGSKEKFWFRRDGHLWLYKEARVIKVEGAILPAGEDWAEKIASEVAHILSIPAVTVELSEFQGRRGCASLNFSTQSKQLEHGNEVMAGLLDGYDRELRYRQSSHTVENIVKAVSKMFRSPREHLTVLQQLASYLVLDALIGNTDRHHENWGFLWQVQVHIDEVSEAGRISKEYEVAPAFDLGSSLGRELLDTKRALHLEKGTVEKYLRKARGGIYIPGAKRGESPLTLVELTAQEYPDYFRPTLDRLRMTSLAHIFSVIDRVPEERMTMQARNFAKAMIGVAYDCLRRIV
jgi:hypothetical protein